MFGLKEENGREEKMNQGGGKNVDPCDRFLNKFNSFLFLSFYPNSRKDLISLPFLPFPFKPNKVIV